MRKWGDPSPTNQALDSVLSWKDNSGQVNEYHLRQLETVQIGRDQDNDIVLQEIHISRHHAVINWRGGFVEITDLGSANGTLVNGRRLNQPHVLRSGDVIRLYSTDLCFSVRPAAQIISPGQPVDRKTLIIPKDTPQPRLMISAGPEEGKSILLHAGKMVIGRSTAKENWDIALQDRSISRPHAQIEMQGGGFVLSDLGSANDTLVNGEPIREPRLLLDGDVILVGETTLLFRIC